MPKKLSKTEAEKEIEDFFKQENFKDKSSKDIKKIKKLAMRHNIKLGEKRKLFCKKCYSPYKDFSLRIKNNIISILCGKCKHKSRWKVEFNFF